MGTVEIVGGPKKLPAACCCPGSPRSRSHLRPRLLLSAKEEKSEFLWLIKTAPSGAVFDITSPACALRRAEGR